MPTTEHCVCHRVFLRARAVDGCGSCPTNMARKIINLLPSPFHLLRDSLLTIFITRKVICNTISGSETRNATGHSTFDACEIEGDLPDWSNYEFLRTLQPIEYSQLSELGIPRILPPLACARIISFPFYLSLNQAYSTASFVRLQCLWLNCNRG